MIKDIEAKVLVSRVRGPDPWFGLHYGMNLYRGCQHQCIYCDSRSACYEIEDFRDILVKRNAIALLEKELPKKRVKGTIGTGSMNDPYMPVEEELNLTGRALAVIAKYGFPVHIITKSDLVLRDLPILKRINRVGAVVSFTITTCDDALAAKVEPYAPPPSARLRAMKKIAAAGIETRIAMMPILPFIEDTDENVTAIVNAAGACGAKTIIPWFGMTLRDRQRAYYYDRLNRLFPGLRTTYEKTFGDRYECISPRVAHLAALFHRMCEKCRIETSVEPYVRDRWKQLGLF
jgi:DNA repair photolyase